MVSSNFKKQLNRSIWVAQSVKHPTLDLGSGHDLMAPEIEPHIRLCADSKNLPGILCLLLSLPLPCLCAVSLFLKNKQKLKK